MSFEIAIPTNWRRSSVSKYCHVQLGKMLQSDPSGEEDELQPYLRAINIAKNGVNLSHQFTMWIKPHEKEKFLLRNGDVLVSEGGDAGRTAHFAETGQYYFQNAINRVRPLDRETIDDRYLYYWFTFLKLAGYVELVCNVATIAHFTAEKVKASPFAFPSLVTQKSIASLLDKKTARIDALIAKKRELLERLAERRQAIITQAVTKGLDPAAPMKDSGIDWLGQIPAHWEVRGLTKCTKRIDYRGATPEKTPSGVFLVTAKNVKGGRIDYQLSEEFIGEDDYDHVMRRGKPNIGDVLFTTEAPLGEIANVDRTDIALAQRIIKFSSSIDELDNYYLALWMQSSNFQADLQARATGSTALGIKASKIVELRALLPPIGEQKDIVSYVRKALGGIDEASGSIRNSLELAQEYRSAMVTAAVTGKLEV